MNPSIDPYIHNTFWQKDQIAITFGVVPDKTGNFPHIEEISAGLKQQQNILNAHIRDLGFVINVLTDGYTPSQERSHSSQLTTPDNMLPQSVFLFSPSAPLLYSHHTDVSPMVGFFSIDSLTLGSNLQPETDNIKQKYGDNPKLSPVVRVVNWINRLLKEKQIPQAGSISILAASPNWLCGASPMIPDGPLPVGCPLLPPIPVPANEICSSSPGLWPITLPELRYESELSRMTGDGVTVFILDTLPRQEQIIRAAQGASERNLLLLDIANNDRVRLNYSFMPDALDVPNPSQPRVGKDIKGRLFGFRMPDHGLFVAGIVHDLAPNANIECVRILNDLCVGDSVAFNYALQSIYNRMSLMDPTTGQRGDLYNKPVVINLSVVIPPDMEVSDLGLDINDLIRLDILQPMQALATLGAVFVAAAGNEGDIRYRGMEMHKSRPDALYPAAFAYHGLKPAECMIPVGAVDRECKATEYSCYPGPLGVATYGGDLPRNNKTVDGMTRVEYIDAPIGVYTSLSYPALSIDDRYPVYAAPNTNSWARWVGTSFATPVVTALAARAFELKLRKPELVNKGVSQIVIKAANKQTTEWTRLGPDGTDSEDGPVIKAVQLHTKE